MECQISAGKTRITVITDRLLRVETENFTELPSQTVLHRDFTAGEADFDLKDELCTVRTARIKAVIDCRRGRIKEVLLCDGRRVTDFKKDNLKGTARTLDRCNGETKLEDGIMSRGGAALMDDSRSLLLDGDRLVRRAGGKDIYLFAYGDDYRGALKDFFALTGRVPLVPRYCLGNWWSRYKAYTQEEYRALMQRFLDKHIPISVATIDMDWHWVDVIGRFGPEARPQINNGSFRERFDIKHNPGWTGYSWNRELFPDHRELLSWLHDRNMKVTLNVHPAQGVRFFEDCYEDVCRALGLDPAERRPIPFDLTDEKFRRVYFEQVHRPLEKEGVDFWWIDWQQGTKAGAEGLDPLWLLNHYHTLDMEEKGEKRPLILSRYGGLGSHRYPLGFSGDTVMSWKSLAYQPYFTVNAANAGYTWWSHDIGGHMLGVQDEQLYLRWLQFGVFSPINRLHSTSCEYMGKEPWKQSPAIEAAASEFLRLRHRLIPYLYACSYFTHKEGVPLCEPMYYEWKDQAAYQVPNQYRFGPALIAAPVTKPLDKVTLLADVKVWLPEGRWTDIFSGRIYEGNRTLTMYRDMSSIPVLAKAGAILPLYAQGRENSLDPAQPHEIWIYRGDGRFDWYEDDGESKAYKDGQWSLTHMEVKEQGSSLRFTMETERGAADYPLPRRKLTLRFRDVERAEAFVNGQAAELKNLLTDNGQRECALELWSEGQTLTVELRKVKARENLPLEEEAVRLITKYQMSNTRKNSGSLKKALGHFHQPGILPKRLDGPIEELRALKRP